jgi:hypothetical protein
MGYIEDEGQWLERKMNRARKRPACEFQAILPESGWTKSWNLLCLEPEGDIDSI